LFSLVLSLFLFLLLSLLLQVIIVTYLGSPTGDDAKPNLT